MGPRGVDLAAHGRAAVSRAALDVRTRRRGAVSGVVSRQHTVCVVQGAFWRARVGDAARGTVEYRVCGRRLLFPRHRGLAQRRQRPSRTASGIARRGTPHVPASGGAAGAPAVVVGLHTSNNRVATTSPLPRRRGRRARLCRGQIGSSGVVSVACDGASARLRIARHALRRRAQEVCSRVSILSTAPPSRPLPSRPPALCRCGRRRIIREI